MGLCTSCRKDREGKREIHIYVDVRIKEEKAPLTPSSDFVPFSPDPVRDCRYKDPRHYESKGCPREDY